LTVSKKIKKYLNQIVLKLKKTIVVAGATGNLGERIIKALVGKDAEIRAIVRPSSDMAKIHALEKLGVKVYVADTMNVKEVTNACMGATCVVSALSGLRDVIVDVQKVLLDAAVVAGVPRFIPSDYSLDFTKLSDGENRNLDWRREFHQYLDKAPLSATSIFNGAFMDMLTGQMPLILFKQNRIFFWGNADQRMDFTTIDDTAVFTAHAALDTSAPRYLRIAGSQLSAREMADLASTVTGRTFKFFRPGGLGAFGVVIKITRFMAGGEKELYPAWQGMQYMHNMLDGRPAMKQLDNNRYGDLSCTTAKDLLTKYLAES
jgi:nucleoside-diphosphate-sugar epimerase